MRTTCSMFCWLCLSLWLAAALTAGAAAIGIFSTMPELQVTLADYAHLDAADQTRLAAGLLTEPIFSATDVLQILLSTLLLIGVAGQWLLGMGRDRPLARLLWTGSIILATGMLWWRVVMIMPSMNRELRLYREAAADGQVDLATQARAAFDAMHPTASTMMEMGAVLLILAVLAGAAACIQHRKPGAS